MSYKITFFKTDGKLYKKVVSTPEEVAEFSKGRVVVLVCKINEIGAIVG